MPFAASENRGRVSAEKQARHEQASCWSWGLKADPPELLKAGVQPGLPGSKAYLVFGAAFKKKESAEW